MLTLPERIRRGERKAFLDPSLPLHLLAELGAPWFLIGAAHAAMRIEGYTETEIAVYEDIERDPEGYLRRHLPKAIEVTSSPDADEEDRAVLAVIAALWKDPG